MALVKEIWVGDELAYCDRISKAIFGEREYGSRDAARKACLHHAYEIIRKSGLPAGASIRERRAQYRKVSLPVA